MKGPGEKDRTLNQKRHYDLCIIGAGAAGLFFADCVSSARSLRVAVVEAGAKRFRNRKDQYWVRSTLKEHVGVNEGRVTAFGGATNTWGGGLIRLSQADLEPLHGRPETGWPLEYSELTQHYTNVETKFGFESPSAGQLFMDDSNGLVRRREVPILPFRKKNFANTFGAKLQRNPNVDIFVDSSIKRFHFSPDRRLTSIITSDEGDGTRELTADHFIVSAGVVDSIRIVNQILKQSGSAPFPCVAGEFFHDHLSFPVAQIRPSSRAEFSRRLSYRFERGMMFGEHFDIESRGKRLPGAFFHFSFDFSRSTLLQPLRTILEATQQRVFNWRELLPPKGLISVAAGLPQLGKMRLLDKRLFLDSGVDIVAVLDLEQISSATWKLEDDHERGMCDLAWDVGSEDLVNASRCALASREVISKLQEDIAFETVELFPDPETNWSEFSKYIQNTSEDTFHASGGLRMGTDDATSLVTPHLALRTSENVYVLSTAVFPRVGTSNPTHTLLALADRLASHILKKTNLDSIDSC